MAGVTLDHETRVKFFPGDVCQLKSDGDFPGSVKDRPKTVWMQLLSLVWNYVKKSCISSDRSLHKLSTVFSI